MNDSAGYEKLSIIVYDGHFDKVHYALVMASGAAALGREVTLFFTMSASQALLKSDPNGMPGWASMPLSNAAGDGASWDARCRERNVANFEELLQACVSMKVCFLVCEMGLRALDITREKLREDVPIEEGGVVTFFTEASRSGSMVFI